MRNSWSARIDQHDGGHGKREGTERTVVDEGCNDLRFGPFGSCIVLFRESVPTAVVSDRYLCKVVLQNGLMEVDDELRGGGNM
jgi:hypothetical protein